MLPLLLALGALLAPMPVQPLPVQYATSSPGQPVIVDSGTEVPISLEDGHVVGLDVLASDGIITPNGQCAVVFAAAAVGATRPVQVTIETGQRGGPWEDVGSGSMVVPLVTVPLALGQSIRLVVRNDNPGPVVVWPSETRLSVIALDCVAPFAGGVALQHQQGIFAWLGELCSDQADSRCVNELVRHYHAVDDAIGSAVGGPPTRPPQIFRRAAPWLFMHPTAPPRCDTHARTTPGPEHARAPGPGAFDHPRGC